MYTHVKIFFDKLKNEHRLSSIKMLAKLFKDKKDQKSIFFKSDISLLRCLGKCLGNQRISHLITRILREHIQRQIKR